MFHFSCRYMFSTFLQGTPHCAASRRCPIAPRASAIKKEPKRLSPRSTKLLQNVVQFPGEDAPGTGRRHFPTSEEREVVTGAAPNIDKHHLVTTQDYYAAFPSLVHTSCPLEITDRGKHTTPMTAPK